MKVLRLLCTFTRKNHFIKHSLRMFTTRSSFNFVKSKFNAGRKILATKKVNGQLMHTEIDESEELLEDVPEIETEQFEPFENARNILFKDSNDKIISELNKCASVEEVLNLIKNYIDVFDDAHITQAIFVLKDLQNICYHYSSELTAQEFVERLYKSNEFQCLIKYIGDKLYSFNPEYLSYVLLYLNKLGTYTEEEIIQKISLQIRDYLLRNFSLGICARLLKVIFSENSVRPYYISLNLIPKITSQIGKCESAEDLGNLTACLNSLHNIVTSDLLKEYKKEVRTFLNSDGLKGKDYPVLLKIILFLNHAKWKNENTQLISDCILLMQNEISLLNVTEIISLYQVFFKNQEPGEALNDIQRCSAKHLQRLESEPLDTYTRLKLFSSLIFFSSPTHRIQFRKEVHKYVNHSDKPHIFLLLRKILSYIKVSDVKLCAKYWDSSFKLLDKDKKGINNVVDLCQNYMYFNTDIDNYRHYKFEHKIMRLIEETVKSDILFYPRTISGYLSFAIVYGKSGATLKYLIDKFENNLNQFNAVDCLKISHSISLLTDVKDNCIQNKQVKKLKESLSKCSENIVANDENNLLQNSLLIKAAILRNDYDNYTVDNLLLKYKEMDYMSSKFMENICYLFLATDSLIPEVINKCTEYVIKNPNNILAFNIEKILFLCFYLAYYPINADKFFEVVTDTIIRDQERLSGLAFLQGALSLCYFNKLPSSFIKQVFNVEFMEKLDSELANCYSKDKYPHRVRNSLMQLNRAVCLEYPEYNVPWFHKKYTNEFQKRFSVQDIENHFQIRIREYLEEIVGKSEYILENVITPYGYHIDFVINLNNKQEPVLPTSTNIQKRLALLLVRQHAFARFYTQLKGKYQLKIRHLEIMEYSVAIIKFNEWINLLYSKERLEYLTKIIWPSNLKITNSVHKR